MKSRNAIMTTLEKVFSTIMMKTKFICLILFHSKVGILTKWWQMVANGGKWWRKGSKWHLGSI
jgi:hypothetical protein